MWRRVIIAVLMLLPGGLLAQEPRPAVVTPEALRQDDGIALTFVWRYAPGDGAGRELPQFDDSRWAVVAPALTTPDLPGGRWGGVGWFRRHVVLSGTPDLVPLAVRVAAPGRIRVFVDGRQLIATGESPLAELPGGRADAVVVKLAPGPHVIAVRYAYPAGLRVPVGGFGFQLTIATPGSTSATSPAWLAAVKGGVIALPLFLAALHFALYAFDRRARENLYYALEMLTFTAILFRQYRSAALPSGPSQDLIDSMGGGLPVLAILFGALTYYSLRLPVWPRSWRIFAGLGVVLYALSWISLSFSEYLWMAYFVIFVFHIVHIERTCHVSISRGTKFYLWAFAIFGLTVLLQVLINFGVIDSVAGIQDIYVVGILVSAVGMSLYLANTIGESRVQEAEHQRKTVELRQARELQLSMLPRELPAIAGLDIAVTTRPAAEVGGDYYDVRDAGGDALLVAFGDATGHGLSSGIVVTAAKALFTSLRTASPPDELLSQCDAVMAEMRLPTLRMCLTLARLSRGEIVVASAAMPPVLIHRASTGEVEELGAGGLPLGSRLRSTFESRSATLAHGDTLLFASDGLAESTSSDGVHLGYDGVANAFRDAARRATAQEVLDTLVAVEASFRGSRVQEDDVTMLVARVTPAVA